MGQRIHFYKNNFDKNLKGLIIENYSDFAKWYVDRNESSIEEFDEKYGTEQLINFLSNNKNIENDLNILNQKLIDELTAEFVAEYSESHNLLEFFGPSMNIWRYKESTKLVIETKNNEFIQLWEYLICGRSLKNSESFDSYTNDYKIGFLSFEERLKLKELIITYFGNLSDLKEKFWTKPEQDKLNTAIKNSKNGTYSLTDHNPITSGFEYVLESLNQMKDNKSELITGIE